MHNILVFFPIRVDCGFEPLDLDGMGFQLWLHWVSLRWKIRLWRREGGQRRKRIRISRRRNSSYVWEHRLLAPLELGFKPWACDLSIPSCESKGHWLLRDRSPKWLKGVLNINSSIDSTWILTYLVVYNSHVTFMRWPCYVLKCHCTDVLMS